MDCEAFDLVTIELLYDELDDLRAATARRHLSHCTRCQGIFNGLRATRDVADIPLIDPPITLFDEILERERQTRRGLTVGEKASRAISVMAGYAMKPQLAMAALLLLMIGSSLVFVKSDPSGRDQLAVTELGAPATEPLAARSPESPRVYDGDGGDVPDFAPSPEESDDDARAAGPTEHADARAQTNYAEAMTAYQGGRYAEAERLFGEVAAVGGEKAASAALHEGHAARNGSGCQRAAELYDRVATRFAGSTLAREAAWHAASCYQALGQVERARAHYAKLAEVEAFSERATLALGSLAPRPTKEHVAGGTPADSAETTGAGAATPSSAASAKPAAATANEVAPGDAPKAQKPKADDVREEAAEPAAPAN